MNHKDTKEWRHAINCLGRRNSFVSLWFITYHAVPNAVVGELSILSPSRGGRGDLALANVQTPGPSGAKTGNSSFDGSNAAQRKRLSLAIGPGPLTVSRRVIRGATLKSDRPGLRARRP